MSNQDILVYRIPIRDLFFMLKQRFLIVCIASFLSLPFASLTANADGISNSYTSRQKQLATAIAQIVYNYYQNTGQPIPITNQSIIIIMSAVGATPQEAAFIQDRIVANSNTLATPKVDTIINRAQNILNCLNTVTIDCIR
ncbi:hypothetical protein CAL7716_106340 (plasmid) [Calothrix sp. PCC 7716]|nr:hypothetical protein CAL7716_106340 [Calothrix sp. PCC 7716]